MTVSEQVLLGLSLLAVVLAIGAAVWLTRWYHWCMERNNATSAFRKEMIDYAFSAAVSERRAKIAWYEGQASYDEMCPLGILAPWRAKPLEDMVIGEYRDDFLAWWKGEGHGTVH